MEGLGHLEIVDMDMSVLEENGQLDSRGGSRRYALGKEAVERFWMGESERERDFQLSHFK